MKKPFKKITTGNPGQVRESDGGLGFGLLDVVFPFLIPVKGVVWIGKKLKETADAEITDKSKVQEELLELQMRFEMGEIGEEEYEKKESKLLERLEAIRKYEERKQSG
ncbi:MAG: gas vesicle protein GvpG [Thermodesulfovibrionales bacterium]|nr:gas vesicle protein GvpG [Thermodesulfovibrionales bacterium]